MLNKKKIFITIFVLLVILSLSVLSVLAFEFRQPVFTTTTLVTPPSLNNVQDLAATLQLQLDMQMGSTLGRTFYMLCYVPDGDRVFAIVSNADQVTVTAGQSTSVIRFNQTAYRLEWNQSTGFYQVTNSSSWTVYNQYVYYANFDYPATNLPAFHGFNPNATFGSQNYDTQTALTYYQYIYDSVMYRDERESSIRQEAQSEGESIGFEEGAEAGYFHGYDIGYADGLDEGEANGIEVGKGIGYETGYESGYADGLGDGYDTGYADGYKRGEDIGFESGFDIGYETGLSDGYETGLSDGYETGYSDGLNNSDFKKSGQIIAQFWRYRDDSEYQGKVYFCTTNYNGVSGFRWCTEDEIFSHYLNCEVYDYVYETNLYFQNHPLEFNYFVPQIVRDNSTYSGALSVENVEYRFVDLYNQRAVIELDIDPSITGLLNDKYNEGINDSNALVNGVSNIASKPITSLKDALDFEIFGINIGVVAVGIVAILFAIWAFNKIRKILPI